MRWVNILYKASFGTLNAHAHTQCVWRCFKTLSPPRQDFIAWFLWYDTIHTKSRNSCGIKWTNANTRQFSSPLKIVAPGYILLTSIFRHCKRYPYILSEYWIWRGDMRVPITFRIVSFSLSLPCRLHSSKAYALWRQFDSLGPYPFKS